MDLVLEVMPGSVVLPYIFSLVLMCNNNIMAWVWADNTGTEVKPEFVRHHYFELFASQLAPA